MTPEEIEGWLWKARDFLKTQRQLPPSWWPNTTEAGTQGATALAYLFFMEAAASRCSGKKLTAAANAADGSIEKDAIEKHWLQTKGHEHSPNEVLVDFSIHNWDASSPIQLTGESEAYPYFDTGDTMEGKDDYSWDFYKLLVIPSTTRLFFARIGKKDGVSIPERMDALVATLQGLIDWYAPALLRPHDELGAVILPTRANLSSETRVLWLDRGRLKARKATPHPDVNQAEDEDDDE